MPEPYVVVGTGIAGATAALTLRAEGWRGPLVLIGQEPEPPYRRPPLSKEVLRGGQAPARTALRPVGSWAEQDIELRTGTTVTRLDPARRRLVLGDGGELRYARLLLATGGRPRVLPATAGIRGVHQLRTLAEATALRDALAAGGSLLVVGAGLIGLEVAAVARQLGCEVTVAETAPEPLGRVLPARLARAVTARHRDRGVDLRTGVLLDRFEEYEGGVAAYAGGELFHQADRVVVAVGAAPATALAEEAGLAVDDGILVDAYGATSAPDVFAAGEVARRPHPLGEGTCRAEHWTPAQEHGAAVARAMLGKGEGYRAVPWYWTHQYEVNLQVAGYPGLADRIQLDGSVEELDFAALLWRGERLVGTVCAGRPRAFPPLRALIGTTRGGDGAEGGTGDRALLAGFAEPPVPLDRGSLA
ncbi:rubredoxin reductase [Streptomyces albus]|uniref:Rubredoxin reductase n=1 Tax=Streptomyces albus (strain ATCC 21838 / DSM 41398 / FERM P-419 / JCM 4703 / NBRC 107858) TaxID=1081613 RepID=A0A0B5ET20_STRA4|nr:rubredoxin reductase [Streptomyces albus]AOU75597.1 rubredoxin reductase [Streptomyces albus]AYN31402.1 FAD-dependent oxidoreductase [Streptomyces albus]